MIYGVLLSLGLGAAFLWGKWYGQDIGYRDGREAERKTICWGPPSDVEARWYWEYSALGGKMIQLGGVIADQAKFIERLKRDVNHEVHCLKHGEVQGVLRCPQCEIEKRGN